MQTYDLTQQILASLPLAGNSCSPAKFLVIPAAGEPRWLLPDRCRKVDSVLSSWSPYRLSSRLKWQTIRVATRIGAASSLPNTSLKELRNPEEIDWRLMGWTGAAAPVPVVYVGTPGRSRKAVIHLLDPSSGQCQAVVKVPLGEAAKGAILREAAVLAALSEQGYAGAPHSLHVDRDRGIATQNFVAGAPGGRRLTGECWSLLASLLLPGESTSLVGHAAYLQERVLGSPAFGSHFDTMAAALAMLCDSHPLPACWVHGDFAPWNIKRRPGLAPMLIDWEDARRDGLPLQDAYHFLHWQDYLFGARPALHSPEVERFAGTIGITATQCRQLEIVYLAEASMECLTQGDWAPAEFLMKALQHSLRAHRRSKAVAVAPSNGLDRDVRRPAPDSQTQRAKLFADIIEQLNSDGIRYCVLGGYENDSETGGSDVDIMVHPQDMARTRRALAASASCRGPALVQAMQHEIGACYFILASYDGERIGFIDPDCCTDYRRDGRLWLKAEAVLAARRPYRNFYLPSIPDQFTYYLLKKVLKQSVTACQLKRLQHSYMRDPAECGRRLPPFWTQATIRPLQRALEEQNLAWFQSHMQGLLLELKKSEPVEGGWARMISKLRDQKRQLCRALGPSGLSVLVVGGESGLRSEIANGLLRRLAPAFRWTAKTTLGDSLGPAFSLATSVFGARHHSTLIVGTAEAPPPAAYSSRLRTLASLLTRRLFAPDLAFDLGSDPASTAPTNRRNAGEPSPASPRRLRTVSLTSDWSGEEIIRHSSRIILQAMAERMEQRLRLSIGAASLDGVSEAAELHPAGLR